MVGLVGPVSELKDRARQYQAPGKMLGIMPAGQAATYIFYCVGNRSFEDLKREGLGRFKEEVTQAAPELSEAFGTMEHGPESPTSTPSFIRVDPWVGKWRCSARRFSTYVPSPRRTRSQPVTAGCPCVSGRDR